jgi:hypothetical protein
MAAADAKQAQITCWSLLLCYNAGIMPMLLIGLAKARLNGLHRYVGNRCPGSAVWLLETHAYNNPLVRQF